MIIPTDPKISNLLERIGCLWPPAYTEPTLKTISTIWQKKLLYYDDNVINETLDYLAETFHRKPMLADFLETCKNIQNRKTPIAMTVFKEDFVDQFNFRSRISAQYGEEAEKKVDNAFTEYREYKKIGKMAEYRKVILLRSQALKKRIVGRS